jgi:dihydroflavonol-4-reductase
MAMNEPRRVLCTGAAGFIGTHLTRALRSRGHEVWGLLGPGDAPVSDAPSGVRWVHGDLCRPDTLAELRQPFDTVYHLAGLLSADRDDRFFAVNFDGTRNLVEAVIAGGRPRRLVFASSLAATGPAAGPAGRSDTDPCSPVSAYGRSKRMAELYLESLSASLPTTVVRLPLVYGPGSRGGLYAYFRMIQAGCCLIVGTSITTVGYVGDIARGIIHAAENPAGAGQTYFLGDSRPYKDTEIIAAIEAAMGRRAVRIHLPYAVVGWGVTAVEAIARARGRQATVRRQELDGFLKFPFWNADTSRAAREVGAGTMVPLAEGVRLSAAWYREQGLIQ